jgi:hypothetical protein
MSCNSGPMAWRAAKFTAWVAIIETRTMRLGRGEVGEGRGWGGARLGRGEVGEGRGKISDDGSS